MTTDTPRLENMEVEVQPTLVTQCEASSAPDPAAISKAVGDALRKVQEFMTGHAIPPSGPPRVIYSEWSPSIVRFTAAIPIAEVPSGVIDSADVAIKALPECRALRFVHYGPYHELANTYTRIEAWLRERGGIKTAADWARYSPMWEEYMNDPGATPPSELVTRIYLTLT
jgi:effector-binding domain-containing protein